MLAVHALLRQGRAEAVRVLPAEQRGVLGELAEAREQLAPRQRAAEGHVDEDLERRVERPDVVFPAVEADRSLQGRRHVVHGEQGRRHVDQLGPPEQDGGEQAREVHEGAAAEGDHQRALRGAGLERPLHERGEVVPGLAGVAGREHVLVDRRHLCVAALKRSKVVAVKVVNGLVREQQDPVGLHVQNAPDDLLPGVGAQPAGHGGPVGEDEGQRLHGSRAGEGAGAR
mmetsp:Transcript_73952/g.193980  ORF Transcript_73952/g.193980 Transcript_73952/m.193980 type:complete len:228 (-) Transcript_73952:54-737(-)